MLKDWIKIWNNPHYVPVLGMQALSLHRPTVIARNITIQSLMGVLTAASASDNMFVDPTFPPSVASLSKTPQKLSPSFAHVKWQRASSLVANASLGQLYVSPATPSTGGQLGGRLFWRGVTCGLSTAIKVRRIRDTECR